MRIPDSPLPDSRHCRVAVLGDDAFSRELCAALDRATGRPVPVVPRPPRAADVVFVGSCDPDAVVGTLCSDWPGGAVGVVRAALTGTAHRTDAPRSFLQCAQRRAPHVRLVGALHLLSADHLVLASMGRLESDVPVVSDDDEAADLVEALVDGVRGLSAVRVGAARSAAGIEGLAGIVHGVESQRGHPVGLRLGAPSLRFVDPGPTP